MIFTSPAGRLRTTIRSKPVGEPSR